MTTLKFKKEKTYDKGYGYITTYKFGNWEVVNLESSWAVSYKGENRGYVPTLKLAKLIISGTINIKPEMI